MPMQGKLRGKINWWLFWKYGERLAWFAHATRVTFCCAAASHISIFSSRLAASYQLFPTTRIIMKPRGCFDKHISLKFDRNADPSVIAVTFKPKLSNRSSPFACLNPLLTLKRSRRPFSAHGRRSSATDWPAEVSTSLYLASPKTSGKKLCLTT
jgi:hypothetical protein